MKMRSKDQPALGNRVYREQMRPTGLVGYRVWEQESDLMVFTASDLTDIATNKLRHLRRQLIHYIDHDQLFLTSLSPVEVASDAPAVVQSMARAASSAGVGPMAAVAGAIADAIGWELLQKTDEVIIENGGDIFLKTALPRQVLVQAGNSVFSGRIALEVAPTELPLGICTSAGTHGHAFSLGKADAALVVAKDAALADATATAVGNRVQVAQDVNAALAFAASIPGVLGCLVIKQEHLGVWGDIKLVQPQKGEKFDAAACGAIVTT